MFYINLYINIFGMIDVWRWIGDDRIVYFLFLNYVYGVVNVLLILLYCGVIVYMLLKFDVKVKLYVYVFYKFFKYFVGIVNC